METTYKTFVKPEIASKTEGYVKKYKRFGTQDVPFSVTLYRVTPEGKTPKPYPKLYAKLYQAQKGAIDVCKRYEMDCDIEKITHTKKSQNGDYEYFTMGDLFVAYANYTAGLDYEFVDNYEKTTKYVESYTYIAGEEAEVL